jgi:hypothetical protein
MGYTAVRAAFEGSSLLRLVEDLVVVMQVEASLVEQAGQGFK